MKREPIAKGSDVAKEIRALSRDPFKRILERFLESAPSRRDIRQAAKKAPDRWAQSLSIVAKAAGYSEKLELDANVKLDVAKLSDAELEERLKAAEAALIPQSPAPESPIAQ